MADMQHRLLPLRAESSRQDDTVLTVPDAPRASDAEEPAPHREATVVTTPAPTAAEQGTRKGRGRPKKAKPTPGKKRKSTRRAKARGKKAKTQQKEEAVRFFSTSMPTFKKYFHRARK